MRRMNVSLYDYVWEEWMQVFMTMYKNNECKDVWTCIAWVLYWWLWCILHENDIDVYVCKIYRSLWTVPYLDMHVCLCLAWGYGMLWICVWLNYIIVNSW